MKQHSTGCLVAARQGDHFTCNTALHMPRRTTLERLHAKVATSMLQPNKFQWEGDDSSVALALQPSRCSYTQRMHRCSSPSNRRYTVLSDRRGTISLLTMTLVQYSSAAWLKFWLRRPPGGQKAQHLSPGARTCIFKLRRAATPAPKLCPASPHPRVSHTPCAL